MRYRLRRWIFTGFAVLCFYFLPDWFWNSCLFELPWSIALPTIRRTAVLFRRKPFPSKSLLRFCCSTRLLSNNSGWKGWEPVLHNRCAMIRQMPPFRKSRPDLDRLHRSLPWFDRLFVWLLFPLTLVASWIGVRYSTCSFLIAAFVGSRKRIDKSNKVVRAISLKY